MTLNSTYSSATRSGLIFVRFSDRLEKLPRFIYTIHLLLFFFHDFKVELALAARLQKYKRYIIIIIIIFFFFFFSCVRAKRGRGEGHGPRSES